MKQFSISVVVVFIVWSLMGFVVHGGMLHDDYAQLPNVMRPEAEAQKLMPLMMLARRPV